MNELLKAFCILEREHLINNSEKAARSLGIWDIVSKNSTAKLWELAHAGMEPNPATTSMVGSEPVLAIETEPNPEFKVGPPPSPVKVTRTGHKRVG